MDEITDRQEAEAIEAPYPAASASARPEPAVVPAQSVPRSMDVASPSTDVHGVIHADTFSDDTSSDGPHSPGETVAEAEKDNAREETETAATPPPDAEVSSDARPAVVVPPVSARIPVIEPLAPPTQIEQALPRPEPRAPQAEDVAASPVPESAEQPVPESPPISVASTPIAVDRQSAPEVSALIIPFIPRGGAAREAAAPARATPPPQPFARQPIPYFISPADGAPTPTPPPAMPPPPSGFRRPAEWSRQPAALTAVADQPAATPAVEPSPLVEKFRSWAKGLSARVVVKRIFQVLGVLVLAYTTLVVSLVFAYRWVDPPMSALMLGQRLSGTQISHKWMPLERISPSLQLAVVLSEDGRFCTHRGVDWGELREAIEQSLDGAGARGGSTISMQTVKNLFLWPSKSYVRKAVEIPLAMGTEMVWPKARMLEVYLNIAEWGPGIFGAEAAARYHFGKTAAALTPREASLLAVSLPNPFDRQAGTPGPGTQRLADNLQARMRRLPNAAACGKPGRPARPGIADSRWP